MTAVSPELDAKLARIELNGLKSAAGELQLDDDPETMLRTLAYIQGRMAALRGHAKRRIARSQPDDELREPADEPDDALRHATAHHHRRTETGHSQKRPQGEQGGTDRCEPGPGVGPVPDDPGNEN